jgi:excisionase family DNA binding protein
MFIEEKRWLQLQRRGEKQDERSQVAGIDMIPELMSIDQLAQRLGITMRHVRRLVADRRIPYIKVGKLVRFDSEEIAQWLDGQRRPQAGL